MRLDLTDPKTTAIFKINLYAERVSFAMKDEIQHIFLTEWQHVPPEIIAAVNQVTFAVKELIDITNDALGRLDLDNQEEHRETTPEERAAAAKELAEMEW